MLWLGVKIIIIIVLLLNRFDAEWCVLPSTVHIRQNETCKTLADIASQKIVWQAMRGEAEGKQILLDLEPWPADYNLSVSLSVTLGDLTNQKGKIAASNISWWQVGYVYCKETTRYTIDNLVLNQHQVK